jgi:signal peptidase I
VAGGVLTGDLPSGTRPRPPAPPRQRPAGPDQLKRLAIAVAAIAVSVAIVRSFLVQSFVVPTGSMTPTVQAGDRVLVSRLSYLTGDIHRGDVIVFNGAGVFDPEPAPARSALAGAGRAVASAFGLPVGSRDYVKRVIGLPGDRVICCDPQNRITLNGVALDEPYLDAGDKASELAFDIIVPENRLWVLGDHRSDSADSRAHLGDPGGGTVPQDRVVGRVVSIYWPLSHAGGLGPGLSTSSGAAIPAADDRKDHR